MCTLVPWEGLEWLSYLLLLFPSAAMPPAICLCLRASNAPLLPPVRSVAAGPGDPALQQTSVLCCEFQPSGEKQHGVWWNFWLSRGVTFSSPAPCVPSLLPTSCHGAPSLHLAQSNNIQSCHTLPTEHSKVWQWIDPFYGSYLICPYVKHRGNGIMYYCNE